MSDEVFDPYDLSNYSKKSLKKEQITSVPNDDNNNNDNDNQQLEAEHTHTKSTKNPFKKRKMTDDEDLPQNIDLTKNAYKETNLLKTEKFFDTDSGNSFSKMGRYTFHNDDEDDIENEEDIPLLEDLGVNIENIKQKVISILAFKKIDKKFFYESDMAGPFFIICLFSFTLMLQKKTCFGYLYGISVLGSVFVFLLLNLMSKQNSILLYNTISILGYSLLPVVIFSLMNVFFSKGNILQVILSIAVIVYCSISATRFFEISLEMQNQRILIFYPVALFYTCFVLVTIF